jgi:hypothetical protein
MPQQSLKERIKEIDFWVPATPNTYVGAKGGLLAIVQWASPPHTDIYTVRAFEDGKEQQIVYSTGLMGNAGDAQAKEIYDWASACDAYPKMIKRS